MKANGNGFLDGQDWRSAHRGAVASVTRMSKWIRQGHRWLAITFVVTTIITFIALMLDPTTWITYVPLFPLLFLLLSGLYLFVLPYAAKRRT